MMRLSACWHNSLTLPDLCSATKRYAKAEVCSNTFTPNLPDHQIFPGSASRLLRLGRGRTPVSPTAPGPA